MANFFNLSEMNLNLVLPAVVGAVLVFGLTIYWIVSRLKRAKKISARMDQFVASSEELKDDTTEKKQIISREIEGSLFSRTIASWMNSIVQYLARFTPEKMAVNLEHNLTIAGNPYNLHAATFFTIRLLVFFAGVFVAFLLNRDLRNFNTTQLLLGVLIIAVSWFLPVMWLKSKVTNRQNEISLGLPDALDMLSVCASAGLGFDQSLQKISNYWKTELGKELRRVTQEMELGVSRSDALRNLSGRLEVDELTQFVAIIVQAEKIGLSYADVLHSQAEQMRVLRQLRAREIANKLPAKLIIPLAIFIFPAMIAVILGPAIPTILNLF